MSDSVGYNDKHNGNDNDIGERYVNDMDYVNGRNGVSDMNYVSGMSYVNNTNYFEKGSFLVDEGMICHFHEKGIL